MKGTLYSNQSQQLFELRRALQVSRGVLAPGAREHGGGLRRGSVSAL
jgi:hypothetical protein